MHKEPIYDLDEITLSRLASVLPQHINPSLTIDTKNDSMDSFYEKGLGYLSDTDENNKSLGIKYIETSAALGCLKANRFMARLYHQFTKKEQDKVKVNKYFHQSVEYYQRAMKAGDIAAERDLGALYEWRNYPKEAFDCYQNVVNKSNDPVAQYKLGNLYRKGKGVFQDLGKAFGLFQASAAQECAPAKNYLGVCYEKGEGVACDLDKAFECYLEAAELGDPMGQHNVAHFYRHKKSRVALDNPKQASERAFFWYKKAADQGDARAKNELGICYEEGEGVELDLDKAFECFLAAAKLGNPRGQFNVAQFYRYKKSSFVLQNPEKAPEQVFFWYKKAADQGHVKAKNGLGTCYDHGEGVEHDPEKAFDCFLSAAKLGYPKAQRNVAQYYEHGKSRACLASDAYEQACFWYKEAAQNGNKDAIKRVHALSYSLNFPSYKAPLPTPILKASSTTPVSSDDESSAWFKEKEKNKNLQEPATSTMSTHGMVSNFAGNSAQSANAENPSFEFNCPFAQTMGEDINKKLKIMNPGYYITDIKADLAKETIEIKYRSAFAAKEFCAKYLPSFPSDVRYNNVISLVNTPINNNQMNYFIEKVCGLTLPAQLNKNNSPSSSTNLAEPDSGGCLVM